MNPHVKETKAVYYLEERSYPNGWQDVGMWVEVGGLGLIICTIQISLYYIGTIGFRIVDENENPLLPYRTKNNTRLPVHFSGVGHGNTPDDQTPITFHMIANCKYAKAQIMVKDAAGSYARSLRINGIRESGDNTPDVVYNHKPISTMSVIPLVPNYQGGANTVFTYPHSRSTRESEDDKPPVKYDKNKRKIT